MKKSPRANALFKADQSDGPGVLSKLDIMQSIFSPATRGGWRLRKYGRPVGVAAAVG